VEIMPGVRSTHTNGIMPGTLRRILISLKER
jgi:hypothetical protein